MILAGENPLGPQYEAVARKRERTLGLRRRALLQSVAAARRTRRDGRAGACGRA